MSDTTNGNRDAGGNGRGTMTLKKARQSTPAVAGLPPWIQSLRDAAFDAVREADMTEIFAALVAKAKRGDLAATKLLLSYVMPAQPTAHLRVTRQPDLPEQGRRRNQLPPIADCCKHGLDREQCIDCNPAPTREAPGSDGKMDVLARRAGRGQALNVEDDAKPDLE